MNKNTLVTISILIAFVFFGLLLAIFLIKPDGTAGKEDDKKTPSNASNPNPNTTTPNPNTTTSSNPSTGTDVIYDLADDFRAAFLGSAGNRCGEIRAVSHLTDAELQRFSNYYNYEYGLTPLEEMAAAYVWCPFSFDGTSLYNRFNSL